VRVDERILSTAKEEAARVATDKQRASSLLGEAMRKAEQQESRLKNIWGDLQTLFRLVRAWVKGAYREVPWKTIVLAIAAILYFLDPLDMIPDAILGIGYLDDATVIAWVVRSIKKDMDRFAEWERAAQ
jgi:uncharacterized membrane protein YkvA (DUF1232 family)